MRSILMLYFVFLSLFLWMENSGSCNPVNFISPENPISMPGGLEAESPVLTFLSDNQMVLAWREITPQGDAIYGATGSLPSPELKSIRLSTVSGLEGDPFLCREKNERVWLIWAAKRDNHWGVYGRLYSKGHWESEKELYVLKDKEAVGLYQPSAAVDSLGNLWFAWEEIYPDLRSVIHLGLYAEGAALKLFTVPEKDFPNGRHPFMTLDQEDFPWLALDVMEENRQRDVYLLKLEDRKSFVSHRVTEHPGTDICPSLAVDSQNRIWLAWMSDRKQEGGYWSQARWFYLRCWDGHQFLEPMEEPHGKDLTKSGPEQSFEFPLIKIDSSGRIWITGRPSQGFYAQYYEDRHWSPLISLSNPENWGGRGKYLQGDFDGEDNLWVTRRDIRNNLLQKIPSPSGKALSPCLKPVNQEESNQSPLRVKKRKFSEVGEYHLYFGDLHTQSWVSDGVGLPEEMYEHSRDRYGFDFAALTDHEDFVQNRISPFEWEYIKSMAKHYHQPGSFVTFAACEWTDARYPKGAGHKNLYFLQDDPPLFYHSLGRSTHTQGLYECLRPWGGIAIPHHIGWTGVDWENLDSEMTPVVEIVSAHGAYEYMGNLPVNHRGGIKGCFIQDGWKKGLKFGVIGGSDTHGLAWHHGVSRKEDSNLTGLAGVWVKDLTRESIMEALKSRRCYATSGVPIYVDFRINHKLMGETLTLDAYPTLSFQVLGTSTLDYVYLLRDGEIIYASGGDGKNAKGDYLDTDVKDGNHYYTLRVVQKDGEMAWSSPVWVEWKK